MMRNLIPKLVLQAVVFQFGFIATYQIQANETNDRYAIGVQKQLLVDDAMVAEQQGVERRLGKVTKENGGKPIFDSGRFYGTVLHRDSRFKLWYRKPAEQGYGYAESRDGLHFAHTANVEGITFAGDYTMAVEFDEHESDTDHRYKASFDAPGMAAGIAASPDGIHWSMYNQGKPVTKRAADSYNQILWDPLAKTYRLFTRTDIGTAGGASEIRGTRGMTNADAKKSPLDWKVTREWYFHREGVNEPARRQIYATTCWIHEGIYFALLSVYEFPGDVSEGTSTDTKTRHERDVMNFYIATSRDGDSWDLAWVYAGKSFVPRGENSAFDKDLILPASTIVTHDDKHWIYYCGANERHGTEQVRFDRHHAIGLATLPLDRFVSLSATGNDGRITTKPMLVTGNELLVNADALNGVVRIEVLDISGTPFADYSGENAAVIQHLNSIHEKARWHERDLSAIKGKLIRLRFHLDHASLYAFQIR